MDGHGSCTAAIAVSSYSVAAVVSSNPASEALRTKVTSAAVSSPHFASKIKMLDIYLKSYPTYLPY